MEIQIDKRSNRIVVTCQGALEATSGPKLEEAVRPLAKPEPDQPVLPITLDLTAVNYLSSAGIRALVSLARLTATQGGVAQPLVRVGAVSPAVRQILTTSGLLEALSGRQPIAKRPAKPAAPVLTCKEALEKARAAFPSPRSNPERDAEFAALLKGGIDRLDAMKTQRPYLGERKPLDYAAARAARLADDMTAPEAAIAAIASYLDGFVLWGHPMTQRNVVPPPTIPSIAGQLLASICNPNVIWDEYSHGAGLAEIEASAMCASLVGYDPDKAAGIFTFGGTATLLYGAKLGLEKACPGAFQNGVREDARIVSSTAGHYSKINILGWLGIGARNLVSIPTDADNSMGLEEVERILRDLLSRGQKIACIIATMGTTDAFGMDNLEFIVRLRDRLVEEFRLPYAPHVHADAVIGWPWAVFNDYDFDANPMGFPPRALRSLWDASSSIRHLHLADSIGVDFHKTGYGPYISSLFLCKNKTDLDRITRDQALMPYLFQFGSYHPGVFTLEASRGCGGVFSALAGLKLLGKTGYRAILGHTVAMAEHLRARLEAAPGACVVNDYNAGPVTLFRVYPDGIDAKDACRKEMVSPGYAAQLRKHNEYNRRVFDALQRRMETGQGPALSLTDHYRSTPVGDAILALKSFVMSPFTTEADMDLVADCIEKARKETPAE